MKLALDERKTQKAGSFQSEHFGIGDEVVIMQILRSKMYSNPIKTICQEIMSNARDAHREVKTPKKAIKVKLPNKIDPSYQVQDFGPGITPDRMGNVFIKYGNSTKRGGNIETGGFGLGAKSPFAYSDTFTIVTITNELGCNMKREYIAILDESNLGQLNLFKEEKTKEHTGTTLIVTSKPDDFHSFQRYTHNVGLFWDVRPKISGKSEFEWEDISTIMEDKGWKLFARSSWNTNEVVALLDGVPYPVDQNSLNLDELNDADKQLVRGIFQSNYATCVIDFKVGQLKPTANREALEYDKATVKTLRNRLVKSLKEMQTFFSDKLKDAKNLWEAYLLLDELRGEFSFLVNYAKWNGITLRQGSRFYLPTGCEVWNFRETSDDKIKGRRDSSFTPKKNKLLCVEDSGMVRPSRPRIKTLFNENEDLETISVVMFSQSDKDGVKDAIKKWKKENHWDQLEALGMSTVEKFKMPRAPRGEARKLAKVREPNTYYNNRSENKCSWEEAADMEVGKGKGAYVILENRRAYMGDRELGPDDIDRITTALKGTGYKLYGIYRKHEKQIGKGWRDAQEILEAQRDSLKLKLGDIMHEDLDCEDRICEELNKILTKPKVFNQLEDSDGPAAQLVAFRMRVTESQIDVQKLGLLNRILGGNSGSKNRSTLKGLEMAFLKAYPLTKWLHSWQLNGHAASAVVEYINLMDAKD